jgi:2-oxoglutarate ferredoxin oxidoreductase subunit beta
VAFALSRIAHTPTGPTPIGIFRAVDRPVYDDLMAEQIEATKRELGEGELKKLLHAGDTWAIP